MLNTYIIGSDTDDEGEILRKLTAARAELEQMAQEIQQREQVYRVHEEGYSRPAPLHHPGLSALGRAMR